jgi:hypothetical protein
MENHWIVNRCPLNFAIGWLMKTPEKQQVDDDRWYTKPAPPSLPKGHYWMTYDDHLDLTTSVARPHIKQGHAILNSYPDQDN